MTTSTSRLARAAAVAAGVLAFAAPVASAKVVHKVAAGGFDFIPPSGVVQLTNFYPETTSVHVGDSVRFVDNGFHNVHFEAEGHAPLFVQPGDDYGTVLDPAGNPFWFSGAPRYMVNPQDFLPSGTNVVDGSSDVNSGVGFKKFTVTFTQAGTFKFRCDIHPRMTGLIKVVRDSQAIRPGQAQRAAAQKARDIEHLQAVYAKVSALPPTSKVVAVAPGSRHGNLLQFYPSQLTAKVGQTINFVWQGNDDLHTVAFGPDSYIDQQGNAFVGPDLTVNPIDIYPSEPGNPNPVDVSLTSHGNGFVNSGVIGEPGTRELYFGSAAPAQGNTFHVRFTEPGSYHFECLIHVGLMEGEVTVTP